MAVPNGTGPAQPESRNDRIYRETRWLAFIIVPFLLAAFYILYLNGDTKTLFAWEIKSRMTGMMLGAAYIGGAYFFARAFFARQWHWIALGFLPVTSFASMMGIATLLHWDKFSHDNISFYTWVSLYFTTPFLVMATWFRNRRTDPGTPDIEDIVLPQGVRYAVGALGLVTLAISLLLFVQPSLMINVWPWPLTPLTARVVGGMFALPGVLGLYMAIDARWSSAQITLQSQIVSVAFILLAALISLNEFDKSSIATPLFIGGMAVLLIALPAMYLAMNAQAKRTKSKG